MDNAGKLERANDFLSGQINALRVAIIALALQTPDRAKLLRTFQELSQHMLDELLAHPISEATLQGIAAESEALGAHLRQALP